MMHPERHGSEETGLVTGLASQEALTSAESTRRAPGPGTKRGLHGEGNRTRRGKEAEPSPSPPINTHDAQRRGPSEPRDSPEDSGKAHPGTRDYGGLARPSMPPCG